MSCEQADDVLVSKHLKATISDLRTLQGLLLSDDLDSCLLGEFRDVLNRVRNVAWAAQQSVAAQLSGDDPTTVASLLATERIRAAYQLCRLVQEDLGKSEIDFKKGQLSELQAVTANLTKSLKNKLGRNNTPAYG